MSRTAESLSREGVGRQRIRADGSAGGVPADSVAHRALSPPVARLRLGRLLRDMRESCGKTQAEAALALECTKPKISKIETGKATIGPGDVRLLVGFYGVHGDPTEAVLELARQARKRNQIRVPDWAQRFVALESIATAVSIYQSELVPALLRTADYAKAINRAADTGLSDEELERLSAVLDERRTVLDREQPPRIAAVLNEAVLRRPVGGEPVLQNQLEHLRELADLPNVAVQVLPFDTGAHPAMATSFQLVRTEQPTPSSVVYLEELIGSSYLDSNAQTDWYARTFDRLQDTALSTERSAELLEKLLGA